MSDEASKHVRIEGGYVPPSMYIKPNTSSGETKRGSDPDELGYVPPNQAVGSGKDTTKQK